MTRSLLQDAPASHRAMHALSAAGLVGSRGAWKRLGRPPYRASWAVGGATFELHPRTEEGLAELQLYQGTYEWAERLVCRDLVTTGDICVDVGANIGIYTAFFAGMVGREGKVLAFEPSPVAVARLRLLSGLPQVDIHELAVGATSGRGFLSVATGDSMHSTLRGALVGPRLEVQVEPLDALVDGVADIALLKVDVEGFESDVIDGASETLRRRKVKAAILEAQADYGELEWIERLRRLPGYRLLGIELVRRGPFWRPRLTEATDFAGTVVLLRS